MGSDHAHRCVSAIGHHIRHQAPGMYQWMRFMAMVCAWARMTDIRGWIRGCCTLGSDGTSPWSCMHEHAPHIEVLEGSASATWHAVHICTNSADCVGLRGRDRGLGVQPCMYKDRQEARPSSLDHHLACVKLRIWRCARVCVSNRQALVDELHTLHRAVLTGHAWPNAGEHPIIHACSSLSQSLQGRHQCMQTQYQGCCDSSSDHAHVASAVDQWV